MSMIAVRAKMSFDVQRCAATFEACLFMEHRLQHCANLYYNQENVHMPSRIRRAACQRFTKAFLEHVPTRSTLEWQLRDNVGRHWWALESARRSRTPNKHSRSCGEERGFKAVTGRKFFEKGRSLGKWTWEHCKFHSNSRNAIDVQRGHWQGISKLLKFRNMLKTL